MHRYASEALEESACAARHAGRGTIDAEDVKIGAKAILMRQFIEPPSLADAHAMAAAVNRHPLPKLSNRPGIHVPTEMNLLNDNWDIGPPKAVDASSIELERAAEARTTAGARARAPKTAIEPSALADARDAVAFGVKAPAPAAGARGGSRRVRRVHGRRRRRRRRVRDARRELEIARLRLGFVPLEV